jgi:putative membrane protein
MKTKCIQFVAMFVVAAVAIGAEEGKKEGLSKAAANFLEKAAEMNLAEIELGKLGKEKATSDNAKELANDLVSDHGKLQDQLESIAKSKDVKLPKEPSARHQSTVRSLGKLEGDEFDKEFMQENVQAHKQAVDLYEDNLKKIDDADVKDYIEKALPGLKAHLEMAQKGHQHGGTKKQTDNDKKKKS